MTLSVFRVLAVYLFEKKRGTTARNENHANKMEPAAANDTPGGVYRVSRQFRPTLLLFYVHTLRYYRLHNRWCKKFGCRPPPSPCSFICTLSSSCLRLDHIRTQSNSSQFVFENGIIPLAYNIGEVSE